MGFFDRIRQGLTKTRDNLSEKLNDVFSTFRKVDEELMEELEDALILADVGAQVASEAIDTLRERSKKEALRSGDTMASLIVSSRFLAA